MILLTNKKTFFIISILTAFIFTGLGGAFLTSASEPSTHDGTPLPILMYHFVSGSDKKSGKFIVSEKQLDEDFTYIKEKGFTPVTTALLLAHVNNGTPLPEKPILITFDDGYFNNYTYLFPLLKKYNYPAVLSVIGTYTENYSSDGKVGNNNYSHATWNQLKEMQDSGLVEIGNHTYNLHKQGSRRGVLRKRNEDFEEYESMLLEDIGKLQDSLQEKLGKKATIFTFPFGNINKESQAIIAKLGFTITLGCQEGMNYITSDPKCLINMQRFNRSGKRSTESFFKKIEKLY